MYIRRFKYKPDDVDCRLCTEFRKRKCTLEGCPWIAERIETGVVSYAEAVMKVFSSYGLLRHRLADLVDSYPGTFWIDERHRNRMEWFSHQLGYNPRCNTPPYYIATSVPQMLAYRFLTTISLSPGIGVSRFVI